MSNRNDSAYNDSIYNEGKITRRFEEMTYCDCSSCRSIPKNTKTNPNCLVKKLKKDCKSVFQDWSFVSSFNTQTEESKLCIIKHMKNFYGLADIQKSTLKNVGYKILDIIVHQINGDDDYDIEHQDGNDFCQCDTCTGMAEKKEKVVIYVEKEN